MYYRNLLFFCFQDDLIPIQINTLFQHTLTGEIYGLWNNLLTKFTKNRIFIIKNTVIIRSLILNDQFFDSDIFFHCMVTVQMILCNVQDGTDCRCEFFDSLQLKAADLCYCSRVVFHFQSLGCIRSSDVSYYKYRILCIFHDLAKKCRGSSLAVGSCNSQHTSLTCTVSQFHFSPYRKPLLIKSSDHRYIRRNTRAQNYQIQAVLYFFGKFTCVNFCPAVMGNLM